MVEVLLDRRRLRVGIDTNCRILVTASNNTLPMVQRFDVDFYRNH